MSRRDKEADARREGMAFCVRFLESHNNDIEALKREVEKRGALNIPLELTKEQADEFSMRVKHNVLDSVLALTMLTLRDEFDFGTKRLNRFKARFNEKASCIVEDYTNWEETIGILKDECGIELTMRTNGIPLRG